MDVANFHGIFIKNNRISVGNSIAVPWEIPIPISNLQKYHHDILTKKSTEFLRGKTSGFPRTNPLWMEIVPNNCNTILLTSDSPTWINKLLYADVPASKIFISSVHTLLFLRASHWPSLILQKYEMLWFRSWKMFIF